MWLPSVTMPSRPASFSRVERGQFKKVLRVLVAFSGGEDGTLEVFRRLRDEIRSWIKETFGTLDQ
ncbi:MAG: hypothetical protein JRF06_01060 [Deltaproteobacteria bacterium]|nr:hypothetical protein [Deltaproteobacteria bacterium]MBW2333685.1 hypothetical protein [Deltaproteobacteria bacterium]